MHFFKNKALGKGILGILFLAYPFLIYFFSKRVPLFYFLAGIITLSLLRAALPLFGKGIILNFIQKRTLFAAITVSIIMMILYFWKGEIAPLFYPVVMSLIMSFLFGITLFYPPSVIELFARLSTPNLDAKGIVYTRKVTLIWCLFCLINAALSLITVVINNLEVWVLYNGCISYILMGLLISGEYAFRKYIMKRTTS